MALGVGLCCMIQHEAVRLAWRAMHSGMEGDAFWHGGRCILAWRAMHSGMEGDAFCNGGRCILTWRVMHFHPPHSLPIAEDKTSYIQTTGVGDTPLSLH